VSDIPALFRRLTHGVYVIGVADGPARAAFTAAWVMQASFDPPLLALSVHPGNASWPILERSRGFAVSVLRRGQLELARHFGTTSARDHDKLAGIRWRPGRTGAPVLSDALAFFDCERGPVLPAGDHRVVLGRVLDGGILDPDAIPMSYGEAGDMDGSRRLYSGLPRRSHGPEGALRAISDDARGWLSTWAGLQRGGGAAERHGRGRPNRCRQLGHRRRRTSWAGSSAGPHGWCRPICAPSAKVAPRRRRGNATC
jgi:flavin reductase (DIM6/NTAB) family NADH-FMN oxidoreductase RutF